MTDSAADARSAAPTLQAPDGSGTVAGGSALVIAVDGPSGAGKSSAARGVAARLGLRYLDTGAMYRAVTWWLLEHGIDLSDPAAVCRHGLDLRIDIGTDPAEQRVRVEGVDVTAEIRSRDVSNMVSLVAAVPEVRTRLIAQQRAIVAAAAAAGGIVAEGRDIGTVVAPGAPVKIFLTASEQVRAERRSAELPGGGKTTGLTRAEQAVRDGRDAPQSQMAADAVQIDATDIGLDDVVGRIVALALAQRAGG